MSRAVPRPKWKSSLPWNSPVRTRGDRVAEGAGASERDADGDAPEDRLPVGVDDAAAIGEGSSIVVERTSGDATYQPSGSARANVGTRIAADRKGCRRAWASQPRRRATI